MKVDAARSHYKTVMSCLELEKRRRTIFVSDVRAREKSVAEIERAISSLKALGEIMNAAKDAGLLNEVEQPALLATNNQ